MCVRYQRNNQTTDSPQCARDINETVELKTIHGMREILTKQSNQGESSVCARYQRNDQTKENRQCVRDTNETIKLKRIFRGCKI